MRLLSILAILVLVTGLSQSARAAYDPSPDSVYSHIAVLAGDSLEGREVGEPGEMKAAEYIISVFRAAGLQPRGDSGSFLQAFEFTKRVDFGPENRLTVNDRPMELNHDYLPLNHSASMEFNYDGIVKVGYGIITEDSSHNDYAGVDVNGRAVLISRYAPEAEADTVESDTAYDRYAGLVSKMMTAVDRGATGVFFYTPESHDDTLITFGAMHVKPKEIPIIFLRRAGLEKLGLDLSDPAVVSARGRTDLIPVRDTGYNVVAYLPGLTDSVAVIGAHYDHLGWGGTNSRYLEAEPKIHNGADDNASGTAALLEVARYFASRQSELRGSLLFIAFSGEESGTLGSGHFVRNWTVDRAKTSLMINMDMIGRLAEQEKGLAIMGTGTCPEFKAYFDQKDLGDLTVAFKESGAGPSDHAAFYHDSIPCLMFFTGAHEDYHTPADDIEKIDVNGIVTVTRLVSDILGYFDAYDGGLTFQRTKDEGTGGRPSSLSVTLGIMPDFISEVNGLGVDGVSPDKPADRAGILKGDVIIQMDDRPIGDIYEYMNILGKYRRGDSCRVVLVRATDTLTVLVEFK